MDICAVTRRKECGDRSGSSCKMRETPPRAEHLNRFQWYSDSKGGRPVFRLRYVPIERSRFVFLIVRISY